MSNEEELYDTLEDRLDDVYRREDETPKDNKDIDILRSLLR